MRIAILGAAGRTGSALARAAQNAGHDVIGIARTPSSTVPAGSTPAIADAHSSAEVARGIQGADVVAYCIGPGPNTSATVMQDTIPPVLEAMGSAGVRRLVMVSASGPFDELRDAWLLRKVAKPIVRRVFRVTFADLAAADALVQRSAVEWTILRPPQLTLKPGRGRYRRCPRFGIRITRDDLAQAMLDAIENDASIGHVIPVAN